jgi:hypothetical protein
MTNCGATTHAVSRWPLTEARDQYQQQSLWELWSTMWHK